MKGASPGAGLRVPEREVFVNMRVSTQEVALTEEQAASNAYYKKMFDRVSALGLIGVWECDLVTSELAWTDTVYDMFEIEPGMPLERDAIVAMYEPESRIRLETIRSEAIRRGIGFALDAQIRTGKGNMRWIRITADIESERGKAVRIFGTKQDVTRERATLDEVRWLQTELIHISRVNAMSAMASTLAHELNQPLTAIANYLVAAKRMASQLPAAGADLTYCVEGARSSALRAGEIIRRLREMTVRGTARHERFDVGGAIHEAMALATTGRPELQVSCAVDSGIELVGDRIQIQQVLLNLIQNSYEAGGDDCLIKISANEKDGEIDLRVTDNGPGIDPHIIPQVFDSLVTTKPDGMGIGLSVSRTIVELHGGRISVCNAPEGGACICITLPVGTEEVEMRTCC